MRVRLLLLLFAVLAVLQSVDAHLEDTVVPEVSASADQVQMVELPASTLSSSAMNATRRPIVGVFMAPFNMTRIAAGYQSMYKKPPDMVPGSYVKWLESAGARATPIAYNISHRQLEELLPKLNGVLLPGGTAKIPTIIRHLIWLIRQANDNGRHFPLWAECLGHEWLMESVAMTANVVKRPLDSENISLAEGITAAAAASRLFGSFAALAGHPDRSEAEAQQLRQQLKGHRIAFHNHQSGVAYPLTNQKLINFFNVLSVGKDRNGIEFVSVIEAKSYPIYSLAWHPEKNNFEFGLRLPDSCLTNVSSAEAHQCEHSKHSNSEPFQNINHSPEAILVSQTLANFFVGECRRNQATEQQALKLMWEFPIHEVEPPQFIHFDPKFDQVYFSPANTQLSGEAYFKASRRNVSSARTNDIETIELMLQS